MTIAKVKQIGLCNRISNDFAYSISFDTRYYENVHRHDLASLNVSEERSAEAIQENQYLE